jgi:monofunctional glycosyltransferase
MPPDRHKAWAKPAAPPAAPYESMLPLPAAERDLRADTRSIRRARTPSNIRNWLPASLRDTAWSAWPWRAIFWKSARIFGWGLAGYVGLVLLLTVLYALINPPASTLMLGQALQGVPMRQTWVPLSAISPNLIKAVVISEDAQFCSHWGVDWEAMAEAWDNGGRGASTIPMQTVKNLFLWPGRNYIRKVVELPLAHLTTLVWSKRRMLEIYLNVAEWGPGIYGIEEAAQRSFGRSARSLTAQEAALLAAALPAPLLRNANAPSRRASAHASRVRRQFPGSEDYLACVLN